MFCARRPRTASPALSRPNRQLVRRWCAWRALPPLPMTSLQEPYPSRNMGQILFFERRRHPGEAGCSPRRRQVPLPRASVDTRGCAARESPAHGRCLTARHAEDHHHLQRPARGAVRGQVFFPGPAGPRPIELLDRLTQRLPPLRRCVHATRGSPPGRPVCGTWWPAPPPAGVCPGGRAPAGSMPVIGQASSR
jgi:hypothetical protein